MRDDDIVIHRRPAAAPREVEPERRSVARDDDIVFRRPGPRRTPEPDDLGRER
jgi:hypothetical protein